MLRTSFLAGLAVLIIGTGVARGDSVSFIGDGSTGHFTGTAEYLTGAPGSGDLTITLTNTSSEAGLAITGFGFNSVAPGLTIELISSPSFVNGTLTSPVYGSYDFGAIGGSLATSGVGAFTFKVTGAGADSINALNFFTAGGHGTPVVSGEPMVARFSNGEDVGDAVVPLPPVAWGGMALFGMVAVRKRLNLRRLVLA